MIEPKIRIILVEDLLENLKEAIPYNGGNTTGGFYSPNCDEFYGYGLCGVLNSTSVQTVETDKLLMTYLLEYYKETKSESKIDENDFWFPTQPVVSFEEAKRIRVEFLEEYINHLKTIS